MLSLDLALLGVHFDLVLWCLCYDVLSIWMPLYWHCLSSLARWYIHVWHLAGMCFVQVGRLERCCCCLRSLSCDGSDTNNALWMVIIPFCQGLFCCFSFFGGLRFWAVVRAQPGSVGTFII